jgi:hypothetical protein
MKYIRFYSDAWLSSTRILSNEAKGAWIDLLCFLNAQSTPGQAELTADQLGRLWGVRDNQLHSLLADLKASGVCEIEIGETIVIRCNRLIREAEEHAEFIRKCSESGKRGAAIKGTLKGTQQGTSKRTLKGTLKHTNTNTNAISNSNSIEPKKQSAVRQPPTLDEVLQFCDREKLPADLGHNFYDYYQGQQLWTNKNGKPIDWWHVIRSWERKGYGKNRPNGASTRSPVNRNAGNANEEEDPSDYATVGRLVQTQNS